MKFFISTFLFNYGDIESYQNNAKTKIFQLLFPNRISIVHLLILKKKKHLLNVITGDVKRGKFCVYFKESPSVWVTDIFHFYEACLVIKNVLSQ